jgi:polar amino acid transport system substrate-binding protein
MKKLFVILAVLITAAPLYAEDVMKFGYADTAEPMSWKGEDGNVCGILIDIANEVVQKRMKITVSHQAHPWARTQKLVQDGVIDALITNGDVRSEWAVHTKEAVFPYEQKVLTNVKNPKIEQLRKVKTIEDLKPFKLIVHRGEGWAGKYIVGKEGFDYHSVTDHEMVYQLLAKGGRGDASAVNGLVANHTIKKLGLKGQLDTVATLDSVPFHFVIGKNSPYTKILPQLDEIIREIKEDGTLEKIFSKYQ